VRGSLVNNVYGVAGGRSPRSSLGLERPPLARGFLGGLCCLGVKVLLDFQAHGWEVVHDFGVGKTNDFQTEGLEVGSSAGISSEAIRGVMLRTIEFNHEFSRGAIKIWNERSNRSLPQKSNLMPAQKLIPKFLFRRSQIPTQLLSKDRQIPPVRKPPIHPQTLTKQPSQNPNKNHPTKTTLFRGGRSSPKLEPGGARPEVNP
jgi:hypothetical protein